MPFKLPPVEFNYTIKNSYAYKIWNKGSNISAWFLQNLFPHFPRKEMAHGLYISGGFVSMFGLQTPFSLKKK